MSFIQILASLLNGLLDIILAIPRLVLWFYELFTANSKAESARPALVLLEEELKNNGLLKDFRGEIVVPRYNKRTNTIDLVGDVENSLDPGGKFFGDKLIKDFITM